MAGVVSLGTRMNRDRVETLVIGAGQAGLRVGYYLRRRGLPFVIVDEHERVSDVWRHRWDSLRLFTPGHYNCLPGMPFPGPPSEYPTKDEVADYFETYAREFGLARGCSRRWKRTHTTSTSVHWSQRREAAPEHNDVWPGVATAAHSGFAQPRGG